MEYPTAFFQELLLVLHEVNMIDVRDEFRVIVTETNESECYRIERHYSNHMSYWEAIDWPDALEKVRQDLTGPF
jgi:hypothetical protein